MSGEKNIETTELIAPSSISDSPANLSEKDMGKDGNSSDQISSEPALGGPISGVKAVDQAAALEQGVYYPATNLYDYYYTGYNGTFNQSDDKGYYNAPGGAYTGIQTDNTSMLYYLPGYSPYTTGYMGIDGKPSYASSEYFQQPYVSEAFPCYSYDSTYSGNVSTGTAARSGSVKSGMTPSSSVKSNGYSTAKTNTNLSNKSSALPFHGKVQQSANFSKPLYQNQPLKPLNKLGTGFQATGLVKGFSPASKFSSFPNRNPGAYMQYGPVNYQSNGRVWNNNNYRYKSRETFGKNAEIEALTELTRGPRSDNKNSSQKLVASEAEKPGLATETGKYNLQEFLTEYENAKFFVIKSYSEDDVHKCIKYDVWSSTPNGNRKLDAAFREADAKATESGKQCPVFLFFSVNGSGQFVGVAEMIGQVDFTKNMDFWQLDKWNGFFPIKWHIIKDVPNTLLRHIILENNENRAVTYSRDTQEIGLEQGLEMLRIFKNHAERTSVLDDFNFYENREKSLKARRIAKPASETNRSKNGDYKRYSEAEKELEQSGKTSHSDASSLISLTKNLSLDSQSLKSSI